MREYTLQYMLDYDWIRITAVYDSYEAAMSHAKDLLCDGHIVRLLVRDTKHSETWYTTKLVDGAIKMHHSTRCPE